MDHHRTIVNTHRDLGEPRCVRTAEIRLQKSRIGGREIAYGIDAKCDQLSFAFGPIPFIFFTANGQIRMGRSAWVKMVSPLGLSSSDPIFANNLFGATAIEHEVWSPHAPLV